MKKSILFAMFLGGLFAANAQATGQTELKVKLNPVQSIVVNDDKVVLDYVTQENYALGVSETKNNHLTVFSTGKFKVKVKADANLTDGNGKSIALDDPATAIKIHATQGTVGANSPLVAFSGSEISLSTTDQVIGGSDTAGVGGINVKYTGAGSDAYVNLLNNGTATTLTTNVTYSIVAE
ncbi:hypothetical protein P0M11_13065 [Kaistella sp. PBT33-4]|uniref:hypothetical protein n=1 Tax=Kaistella sp. PBT33-4 TaxID=3032000 RepID=UPI0023D8BCBF|nr:hypothetical protein [Kaistella sp. PBT33-4]MDF0720930.1 hypothetical protein [Kaistella sp. PBT33-4]